MNQFTKLIAAQLNLKEQAVDVNLFVQLRIAKVNCVLLRELISTDHGFVMLVAFVDHNDKCE